MQNKQPNDQLQQQLWELVYDLLPSDEAEVLCLRITSDPDVARAYSRVKLKSELVARAARLDEPPVEFPTGEPPAVRELSTARDVVPAAAAASRLTRSVNWLVGLAAILLIGYVGTSYWRLTSPSTAGSRTVAQVEQNLRTIVTSPAEFHSEVTNPINVRTETMDGSPVSTPVELRFFDGQEELVLRQSATTDDNGNWFAQLPGSELSKSARFEIMPQGTDPQQAVSSSFNVVQGGQLTYLTIDKPYYRPGETVFFRSLTLSRFDLRVDREVSVRFEMQDASGELIEDSQLTGVTERGVGNGSFELPADLPGGTYAYVAQSPQGQFPEQRRDFYVLGAGDEQETIAPDSFINLGQVDVQFFPEGGELVASLSNRVYFRSHDPLRRAVHLEGAILDSEEREISTLVTQHEGRGRFEFTPAPGQVYTLRIDKPVGVKIRPTLPEISHDAAIVMQTGPGVFPPGAPIDVDLYSAWSLGPIVVSASCRGAVVGLVRVERDDFEQLASGLFGCSSVINLAPEAAGVIRVTAYHDDSPISPAIPLVERLVFRRPARALHIDVENLAVSYAAGDGVTLDVVTRDEQGTAQPAVLGVATVDDVLLSLAGDRSPLMTTFYYLTTEIRSPQDLEDANFFLSDRQEATEALDLFLGTQGWRRFAEVGLGQLAQADTVEHERFFAETFSARSNPKQTSLTALDQVTLPPITLAGESSASARSAGFGAAVRRPSRTKRAWLGRIAVSGGAALLIVMAVMRLLHWTSNRPFWIPTVVLSAASLLIGILLMASSVTHPTEVASVPTSSTIHAESRGDSSLSRNVDLAKLDTEGDSAAAAGSETAGKRLAESPRAAESADGTMLGIPSAATARQRAALDGDPSRGGLRPAAKQARELPRDSADAPNQEAAEAEPEATPAPTGLV